jgi:ABC-type multidrug transport system ATPase subunit
MGGPNVLMLDEPTNDFDVETLSALEDLLDSFAGTLIVVSHDRYFLERVCDNYLALMGDGKLRDLPGGLDQYFELRSALAKSPNSSNTNAATGPAAPSLSNAARRELEKSQQRIERSIAKIDDQMNKLHSQMAAESTNFEVIADLNSTLRELNQQKDELEEQWLEISEQLEG